MKCTSMQECEVGQLCKKCREELASFLAWREEADCEQILSDFDLTLAWFSAKGFEHEVALKAAVFVRDVLGGTP